MLPYQGHYMTLHHCHSCNPCYHCDYLQNFEAYHLEFSSLIRQLVGLGDLFCQLNGTEQGSFVTKSKPAKMLCTGHREFGTNRCEFLSKQNALYFR